MMINQEGVGWAMVEGANDKPDRAGDNLVSNTTLFDFDGKALTAFDAYKNNGYTPNKIGIGGTITDENGDNVSNTEFVLTVNDTEYIVNTDKMGGYFTRIPYADALTVSTDKFDKEPYMLDMTRESIATGIDFTTSDKTNIITAFYVSEGENGLDYEVEYSTNRKNAALYVSLYDENGILLGCKKDTAKSSISASIEDGKSYTVKAFLWDDMKPLDMRTDTFVYGNA